MHEDGQRVVCWNVMWLRISIIIIINWIYQRILRVLHFKDQKTETPFSSVSSNRSFGLSHTTVDVAVFFSCRSLLGGVLNSVFTFSENGCQPVIEIPAF